MTVAEQLDRAVAEKIRRAKSFDDVRSALGGLLGRLGYKETRHALSKYYCDHGEPVHVVPEPSRR